MPTIMQRITAAATIAMVISGCAGPSGMRWPNTDKVSPRSAVEPATVIPAVQLELSIRTEKESYYIGEPIYLVVHLRNTGREAKRVMGQLHPDDGAIAVYVTATDGARGRYAQLANVDNDSTAYRELAGGETIGDIFAIFFDANGWVFREPGIYQLDVTYRTIEQPTVASEVASNSISVTIEETPDGSGKVLVVAGDPASFEAGKFLLWQAGDHLVQGQERLTEIIERYPESVLSNYVRFALGKSLSQPFTDYGLGVIRPADCRMSSVYLRAVKPAQISENAQIQRLIAQYRCNVRLGDKDSAASAIGEVRKLIQNRPEYQALGARLDQMERRE